MRDHAPLVLGNFRGTFDRGEDDTVPIGYFLSSQNVRFVKGGVGTRYGTSLSTTLATVKRAVVYKRIGEVQRLLILDGSGNLYDSTNLATPILTIVGMTDFSMVAIFGRAYITPHNGLTGLPGEKVYVYSGAGVARPAAGTAPSAFTLTAVDSATSGSVEAGVHVFGVAYETVSGFITSPGGFVALTSAGAKKVNISNVSTGDSSVVARVIVATKRITSFNGNFNEQTYYIVPDGRIADNTTTTITVDFFDADLMDTANLEQLATIPAGVGIGLYRGRMIVWGEDANSAVVRVSAVGQPESMNEVEGFITVNPGDSGGGVKNCTEYRNQLIMCKTQRTYFSQDNNNEAAFWEVGSVDMSVGTECHGFGKSLDFGENIEDFLLVADRAGLRLFTGTFSDAGVVSFNIDDIWARINRAYFHTIEVAVDTVNSFIYVTVPLDEATSPNVMLYADYSEGFGPDDIRWTTWVFPYASTCVVVDVVDSNPVMKYGSISGNIYKIDATTKLDNELAIEQWIEFPFLPPGDEDDVVNHFTGIRIRARGEGDLQVWLNGLDAAETLTGPAISLTLAPGKPLFRGFNFVIERCSVKLRMDLTNEHFILTRFTIFIAPLWEGRSE